MTLCLNSPIWKVLHQKEVLKTDRFEHKLVTTMRTREEGIGKALGQENKVYEKFKDCSGYDCSPEARARKQKSKGLLLIQVRVRVRVRVRVTTMHETIARSSKTEYSSEIQP